MRPNDHSTTRHLSIVRSTPQSAESTGSVLAKAMQSTGWLAEQVHDLADRVGGIEALEGLDASRHSDDVLDWTTIAEAERDVVAELLEMVDRRGRLLMSDERRCIVRRLIARVAARDPATLRRGPIDLTAAAFMWLMMSGNGERSRGLASTISTLFGVPSCANRGRALFKASGLPRLPPIRAPQLYKRPDVWLADVSLLHSRTRHELVTRRNQAVRMLEREAVDHASGRAVTEVGNRNQSAHITMVRSSQSLRNPPRGS